MDDVGHKNNCVGRARLMEHRINRIERHVRVGLTRTLNPPAPGRAARFYLSDAPSAAGVSPVNRIRPCSQLRRKEQVEKKISENGAVGFKISDFGTLVFVWKEDIRKQITRQADL